MWSSLKNALFESDPNAVQTAQPTAKPVAAVPNTGATPGVVVVPTGNEFVAALRNAIKARASAFTNLLAAADKLASIIPDPATRLKAAFATVGDGRSPKEIIDAIAVHVSDLEGQKLQFSKALEGQRATALGALQSEFDAIKPSNDTAAAQIDAYSQQILQLQQLVIKNNARAAELQGQLVTETARFTASAQQFESALAVVKQELDDQKAAVASTLS